MEANDTRFDTTVCRHCYEQAVEAGIMAAYIHRVDRAKGNCDQCDKWLVDGETHRVTLEP